MLRENVEKEKELTAKLSPPPGNVWAGQMSHRAIQMIRMIPLPEGVREEDQLPEVKKYLEENPEWARYVDKLWAEVPPFS
ncbi:unnamed protein product [Vitrella brassicaformis CCMP3155]|nr:unnamed protein product [Vitrella brassicaformis CCMP3155]|eukprot:CEM24499.1 unnamed protein product [Vitrella brassicaformis CCMP3155]